MIRELIEKDTQHIYEIINAAAKAYKGKIPKDCYNEPYMPMDELTAEMETMTFFGYEENEKLVAVMGIQPVKDVTLIRHAYVLPECQGKGIGSKLLDFLRHLTATQALYVGTWVDATWAIDFYKKHGFQMMSDKDRLLRKYWQISDRQIETSVVLGTALTHFI